MSVPKALAWIAQPIILFSGYMVARGFLSTDTIFYRYALYSFILVVLIMESRVLLGERGKRDAIFFVHLASGGALLILLSVLGFRYTSPLLEIEAVLFSAVSISTGIYLLYRNPNADRSITQT